MTVTFLPSGQVITTSPLNGVPSSVVTSTSKVTVSPGLPLASEMVVVVSIIILNLLTVILLVLVATV